MPAPAMEGLGGPSPTYRGLYSVDFDGATETAEHTSAAAYGLDLLPSGTIALWVKTTDTTGTIFRWWEDAADRVQLMIGVGGYCRMFVEKNNDGGGIDTTGATTLINDGANGDDQPYGYWMRCASDFVTLRLRGAARQTHGGRGDRRLQPAESQPGPVARSRPRRRLQGVLALLDPPETPLACVLGVRWPSPEAACVEASGP